MNLLNNFVSAIAFAVIVCVFFTVLVGLPYWVAFPYCIPLMAAWIAFAIGMMVLSEP